MKKRCTNSACRKFFTPDHVCPYCGKKYPRIPRRHAAAGSVSVKPYSVELFDYSKQDRLRTIKAIWDLNRRRSLREAKNMVDNCPSTIATGLSKEEALNWSRVLHNWNAVTKIIVQP